jgi:transmembrane sensor
MVTALMICCAGFSVSDAARLKYFETPVGGRWPVKLPGGSRMVLNTDSSVKTRVDGPATTHVEILRGEVLFNAPSSYGDLTVSADGLDIAGQDSAFAVRLNEAGDVRVTVAEGQVQLSGKAGALLRENQQITVSHRVASRSVSVTNVTSGEIDRELSWEQGKLIFNGMHLSDAIREINRYNLTQIEVRDASVGNERVGGTFSTLDPFAFVQSVVRLYPRVRWACELGVSDTLVLRLRLASVQPGAGDGSPGCASVTFSEEARKELRLEAR